MVDNGKKRWTTNIQQLDRRLILLSDLQILRDNIYLLILHLLLKNFKIQQYSYCLIFFPHFPYLFLTFLCINRLLKRCLEWLNHYQIIFNHCQSIRVSQLDTYYLMFFVLKNYLNICINKWSVKLSRVFCFSSINEWLIDL